MQTEVLASYDFANFPHANDDDFGWYSKVNQFVSGNSIYLELFTEEYSRHLPEYMFIPRTHYILKFVKNGSQLALESLKRLDTGYSTESANFSFMYGMAVRPSGGLIYTIMYENLSNQLYLWALDPQTLELVPGSPLYMFGGFFDDNMKILTSDTHLVAMYSPNYFNDYEKIADYFSLNAETGIPTNIKNLTVTASNFVNLSRNLSLDFIRFEGANKLFTNVGIIDISNPSKDYYEYPVDFTGTPPTVDGEDGLLAAVSEQAPDGRVMAVATKPETIEQAQA